MDESLFFMILLCGLILFAAVIYCFLSTCLGLQIRRSDIWEALTFGSNNNSSGTLRRSARDRERGRGGYEMAPGFGGVGMGGAEEFEMMRTSRPGRGLY